MKTKATILIDEMKKGLLAVPQKHYFLVELKTWPSGEIPYLTYAFNDEEAKKKGQRFIWVMRWKGRVGKVLAVDLL